MPPAPNLQLLTLNPSHIDLVNELLTTSSDLQDIGILECTITSFAGEGLTFLRRIEINYCPELRNVKVAPGTVERLIIKGCPKMELWAEDREEEERSIDWSSFYNLCDHDQVPETGRLPHCLHQLVKLGKIQVGPAYRCCTFRSMEVYLIITEIPFIARRILRLEERTAHLEGLLRLYSLLNSEEASRKPKSAIKNEVLWIVADALRDSNLVWTDELEQSYADAYKESDPARRDERLRSFRAALLNSDPVKTRERMESMLVKLRDHVEKKKCSRKIQFEKNARGK